MIDIKKKWAVGYLDRFHGHYSFAVMHDGETGSKEDVIDVPTLEIAQQIVDDHHLTLKAKQLLEQAASHLCSDDPDRGDYCICGAHYDAYGMKHKRGCLYKRIKKFLKNSK